MKPDLCFCHSECMQEWKHQFKKWGTLWTVNQVITWLTLLLQLGGFDWYLQEVVPVAACCMQRQLKPEEVVFNNSDFLKVQQDSEQIKVFFSLSGRFLGSLRTPVIVPQNNKRSFRIQQFYMSKCPQVRHWTKDYPKVYKSCMHRKDFSVRMCVTK